MPGFAIGLEEYNTSTGEVVRRGYLGGISPGTPREDRPEEGFVPMGVVGVDSLEDAVLFGMPEAVNSLYKMLVDSSGNTWQSGENETMRLTGIYAVGVGFSNLGRVDKYEPEDREEDEERPELH